jgi:hypothetical protein
VLIVLTGGTINYNNFWNNEIDIYSGEPSETTGNIYSDPMFIGGYDVHLQAFSPLIDAGDPNILDIDGTRSDIGAYGGPLGQAYEYQDLAPAIPDSIIGAFVADSIIINWTYNTEADFSHYQLHRDTISGFEPSIFNQIAEPESSYFNDTDIINGYSYYYRIGSVDD